MFAASDADDEHDHIRVVFAYFIKRQPLEWRVLRDAEDIYPRASSGDLVRVYGGAHLKQLLYLLRDGAFRRDEHVNAEIFRPALVVRELETDGARNNVGHAHPLRYPAGHEVDLVFIGTGDEHRDIGAALPYPGLCEHARTGAVAPDHHYVKRVLSPFGPFLAVLNDDDIMSVRR